MSEGFAELRIRHKEYASEQVHSYQIAEEKIFEKSKGHLVGFVGKYAPELSSQLTELLPRLSPEVIRFMWISISNVMRSQLDPRLEMADPDAFIAEKIRYSLTRLFDKTDGSDSIKGKFRIEKQEGSRSGLEILVNGDKTVFINSIGAQQANVWKKMTGIVPCAPYLKSRKASATNDISTWVRILDALVLGKTEKVYSRYTGMGYNEVIDLFTAHGRTELVEDLKAQRQRIRKELPRNHVYHGHLHNNNLTVEFVAVDEGIPEALGQLVNSSAEEYYAFVKALNALPFDRAHILHRPHEFIEAEEKGKKFIPVVRVIDMDAAKEGIHRFLPKIF